MGFSSIAVLEKSRASKWFLKQLIGSPHKWATKVGISSDAAYSYLDDTRLDKNMPWFLIDELDPRDAKDILTYIRRNIEQRRIIAEDLLPKTTVETILKQYTRVMNEFSEFSMQVLKCMEGGTISADDMKEYEKKRAALTVAEIRLFKLMRAIMTDRWEGVL